MAISDTQKTDYLFKKLGFGVTKTDTNTNKTAANESIASPLLLRGDKVLQQAADIPATKPGSSSGVVTVYTGATTVECTADITATANRTWKTGLTDWIPPEFGSTYLVNVYVHDSGDAANAEDINNKLFITGSGNNDEWFFDYQSGVLHFIGDNLPDGVDFTGKSIYIAGARYTGAFGVGSAGGEDANLGNLTISNVTISTATSGDPIVLQPTGAGIVDIDTTTSLLIPTGNTQQRPDSPEAGYLRFNSENGTTEVYNGNGWENLGSQIANVTSQTLTGDGSTTTFTLNEDATAAGLIVSTNGVVQLPGTAYTVSGNLITFAEAPISSDTVDVRFTSAVTTVNSIGSDSGESRITLTNNDVVDISTTHSLQLPSYTVSEANALSNTANGQLIYVSNGASGSPCLAVYSENAWKTVSLGANISSS